MAEKQSSSYYENVFTPDELTALKEEKPIQASSSKEVSEPKASVEIGPANWANIANTIAPTAIGAVAGNILAKKGPQPVEMTPAFKEATAGLTDAGIAKEALQSNLERINTAHTGSIGQLETTYLDELSKLKALEEKLKETRFRAENLDALDFGERKVPGASATYNYTAVMPGDEIPHKKILEAKDMTTGKHGAGAGDVAERNRLLAEKQKALGLQDYRLRGNLENQLFVPPQKGVTPGEQRLAKRAYELAKAEHDAHAQQVKALADKLNSLKTSTPEGKREVTKKLTEKEIEFLQAQARLKALEPKPSFIERGIAKIPYGQETMDLLGKANAAMNANPVLRHVIPTLGGGLSALQTLSGVENMNKGEKLKGALETMSGIGGLVGSVPHPLARGIGLGMQLPYLGYEGYEGYEYLRDKLK